MFGNWLKTSILMAAIVALFGVVGAMLGGAQGMFLALLFGGAVNLWAYWFSDRMVLAMYKAREVDETTATFSSPGEGPGTASRDADAARLPHR